MTGKGGSQVVMCNPPIAAGTLVAERPIGRSQDLPVPVQSASACAGVFDHAGRFGGSRCRPRSVSCGRNRMQTLNGRSCVASAP